MQRQARGQLAERALCDYLVRRGYDIVARNLRLGRYELDVVARKGPLVVIVEVRTRGGGAWTTGLGSITRIKRERVRRAGRRLWRERYSKDPSVERLRFDAASVVFEGETAQVEYIEYVAAAF